MAFHSIVACAQRALLAFFVGGLVSISHAADRDGEKPVVDASAMLEIYETDSAQAAALLKSQLDAATLVERLETLTEDNKARLVDCLFGRVGEQYSAEFKSADEFIYGTAGDPPEIPNELTIKGPNTGTVRPSTSVYLSFETRDLGFNWTLELAETSERLRDRADPEPGVWVDRRNRQRGGNDVVSHAISLTLDWTVLAGRESSFVRPGITPEDHSNRAKTQPRIHRVNPGGLEFPLISGQPMLISCVPSPENPEEKHAFIFLTTWKLPVAEAKPAH